MINNKDRRTHHQDGTVSYVSAKLEDVIHKENSQSASTHLIEIASLFFEMDSKAMKVACATPIS